MDSTSDSNSLDYSVPKTVLRTLQFEDLGVCQYVGKNKYVYTFLCFFFSGHEVHLNVSCSPLYAALTHPIHGGEPSCCTQGKISCIRSASRIIKDPPPQVGPPRLLPPLLHQTEGLSLSKHRQVAQIDSGAMERRKTLLLSARDGARS